MTTAALAPSASPRLHADVPVADLARLRRWTTGALGAKGGPAAAHAAVEISWVEAGEVAYRIGGRDLSAGAGAGVVVPAGAEHVTSFSAGVAAGALWIQADAVDEIADAFGRPALARRLRPGALDRAADIVALSRVLSAEIEEAAPGYLLAAEALLEAIVVRALRTAPLRGAPTSARHPGVLRALDLVHASYAEPIGVEEMARVAGASRFHFSRLFRDEVGLSPYRYLMRVRIERAAELLRRGRRDVTVVALEVGFSDLGRFARAFRQRFGCNPSQARHRAHLA